MAKPLPFRLAGDPNKPLKHREDIIDGLLAIGDAVAIFGPEEAGKTNVLVHLCECIVLDRPFFGREVIRPGAVVFIAAEAGNITARRVELIASEHGATLPIAVVTVEPNLCEDAAADEIIATIDAVERESGERVVLVIADGLQHTLHGDENSSVDTAKYVRTLSRVRRVRPVATLFVTHSPHSHPDRIRGHLNLSRSLDVRWKISRDKKTGISTLHVHKNRDGGEKPTFRFRIERGVYQDAEGEVETARVVPLDQTDAGDRSSTTGRYERADKVLDLVLQIGGGQRVDRRTLLDRARSSDVVTGTSPKNSAEQLRKALNLLFSRKKLTYDDNYVFPIIDAATGAAHPTAPLEGAVGGDGRGAQGRPTAIVEGADSGAGGPVGPARSDEFMEKNSTEEATA